MWHGVDGMGWWMIWGGLMMLLFWGGIFLLVAWTVQSLSGRSREDARRRSVESQPLEIARERYARGEISRDEFMQVKRDLEST